MFCISECSLSPRSPFWATRAYFISLNPWHPALVEWLLNEWTHEKMSLQMIGWLSGHQGPKSPLLLYAFVILTSSELLLKKKKKEGNIIPLLQGKEEDNPLVCTNCLGNLWVIFERLSVKVVIKQVELKLSNAKGADPIKLQLLTMEKLLWPHSRFAATVLSEVMCSFHPCHSETSRNSPSLTGVMHTDGEAR